MCDDGWNKTLFYFNFISVVWTVFEIDYWPHSEHLRPVSGRLDVGLGDKTTDVSDGAHRGGDEPRQTEQWTDGDQTRQHQQVQMIPVTLLHSCVQT